MEEGIEGEDEVKLLVSMLEEWVVWRTSATLFLPSRSNYLNGGWLVEEAQSYLRVQGFKAGGKRGS